ncbi:hypothetical protein [Companilactobacillus kimchiensis]|uniref:Bacteriocin n=1 Tax=Companilactobacillus kimchiensis TaxID=993692 RepID=A0A0R2LBR1_9LACO|nr:hypothetical protein [Companilactobacillus kimchiensis]KRN99407.1 hypothetical protein IV57_GL002531 [Companilactobacillus kimchiensis]
MKSRKLNLSELKSISGGWGIKVPWTWKIVANGWNHRKDIMSGINDGINMGKGKR